MAVLVTSLSNWLHHGSSQRPLRLQQKCLNTYDNEKQDQLSLPSDAIRNPSEQTLDHMWQVFVSRLISQAVPTLWSIKIVVVIQTNGGSVKTTKEKIEHLKRLKPLFSMWSSWNRQHLSKIWSELPVLEHIFFFRMSHFPLSTLQLTGLPAFSGLFSSGSFPSQPPELFIQLYSSCRILWPILW